MDQKPLMENIKDSLGEDVANQIKEKIAYLSDIYILTIADSYEVTEESMRIKFASYQAKYPNRTFESYVKYLKNWDEDRFTFVIEPMGYFLDEQTAIEYAEANMGDINECGAFPYAIVSSIPLNRVYPTCNFRTHKLFEYNKKTNRYESVDWDAKEDTRILLKRGEHGAF